MTLTIDNIKFKYDNGVTWDRPGVPDARWIDLVTALATRRFEVAEGGKVKIITSYAGSIPLRKQFIDSHDADGCAVPGGRPSGLYFDVIVKPDGEFDPGQDFITGHVEGKPFVAMVP